MNRERLCLYLLFGLLFLGLTAYAEVARGQEPVAGAPESLVLRFDASTSDLNHSAIYAAIASELHMILADEGSELAATLIVSVTADGDVQLTYRPERDVVTRTVALTNTSNVPQRIAQLAGNLVRDEAGALLAELQPTAPPAPPLPPVVHPTSLDPWAPGGSAAVENAAATPALAVDTEPYLANRWISTLFIGGSVTPAPIIQFAFHQTKRFDRLEIGIGAQFAYGYETTVSRGCCTEFGSYSYVDEAPVYRVGFPVSAEYRALGHAESYLQLGTSFAPVFSRIYSRWTDPTLGIDLHATAGFQVGRSHGIAVRGAWSHALRPQ